MSNIRGQEDEELRDDFDSDHSMIHDREELFASMGRYSSVRSPNNLDAEESCVRRRTAE
jgi:hypothetical protein